MKLPGYWNNIATDCILLQDRIMDFLKNDVRYYFFGGYDSI